MNSKTKERQVSKKIAQEVMDRDEYCIMCGNPYNLDIAHFIGKGRGGLGVRENLVVLCRSCHHAYDNGKDEAKKHRIEYEIRQYLDNLYPSFTDDKRVEANRWDTREF